MAKLLNRRNFLKTTATGAVTASLLPESSLAKKFPPYQEEEIKIRRYRTLGRTGFKVSDIGFGASFLTNPNVLQVALDMGVNYLDTGEHYGGGRSENTIGEALKGRNRKDIFITTKLNLNWGGQDDKKSIKNRFRRCLERMETEYADCLMIHMCTDKKQVKHKAFHAAAEELKSESRLKYIGLSNHGLEQRIYGNLPVPMEEVMLAAAEDGRFDVGLFVYNFLQKDQGEKIIAACKAKGMGVTLMKTNPVKVYNRRQTEIERYKASGRPVPQHMQQLMRDYKTWLQKADVFKEKYGLRSDEQVRDAAIKFVITNPDVHTVCASINDFDELNRFVRLSGQNLIKTDTSMLKDYDKNLGAFYCRHGCGICETACDRKVPVNTILRYNHYLEAQKQEKYALQQYNQLQTKADTCSTCRGECEKACPYGVKVRSLLTIAHENLSIT